MNTSQQRWFIAASSLAALALTAMRFWDLSGAPNGFYADEAAIAAQVMCVATTGHDASGQPWPLYADVLGGGQASAVMLYPASLWYLFFGGSVTLLRAFDVMHGVIAVLAVAVTVWLLSRSLAASLAALVVSLCNPWWFTATRVFWDPVVGATWWTVGLALYFAGRSEALSRNTRTLLWSLATVAAAGAAYGYAALRPQLLVATVWIACVDRPWRSLGRRLLIPAALGVALLLPLAYTYVFGDTFANRGSWLALWSETWLERKGYTLVDVPWLVLRNLALHLDPAFLFLHGDANLRHSTGFGGVLGATGLVVPLMALLVAPSFVRSRTSLLLIGLFVAGLLGSALTWEGQPHALRSLGAVGPLLLGLGLATAAIVQSTAETARRAQAAVVVIAVLSCVRFGADYFSDYRDDSRAWFSGAPESRREARRPGLARRYYDMQERGGSCRHESAAP